MIKTLKSKLYHIPLWIAYELFWFWLFGTRTIEPESILLFLAYLVAHTSSSYAVIYGLVPKFLPRKRYFIFVLGLIGVTALATGILILVYYLLLSPFGAWETFVETGQVISATFASNANTIILVLLLKLGKEWLTQRRQTQEITRQKLETELNFLRAQWNPHFLFNTINSIYFLIKKNPDLAAESLVQFSDLLRYQLYECTDEWVSLSQEMSFLQNFIALERLRKTQLTFASNLETLDLSGYSIAPNVLLPFIENAFKYAPTAADPRISICLSEEGDRWKFTVQNSFGTITRRTPQNKDHGIGLSNVKRRLELTYADTFDLNIDQAESEFTIKLTFPKYGNT
ncbi:MAG: sensor histidine kinase [Bacteroidota bacterium]